MPVRHLPDEGRDSRVSSAGLVVLHAGQLGKQNHFNRYHRMSWTPVGEAGENRAQGAVGRSVTSQPS